MERVEESGCRTLAEQKKYSSALLSQQELCDNMKQESLSLVLLVFGCESLFLPKLPGGKAAEHQAASGCLYCKDGATNECFRCSFEGSKS